MEALALWMVAHAAEIGFGLLLADRIVAATPPDLVIWKIPIGKWDNQLVDGAKWAVKTILGKK